MNERTVVEHSAHESGGVARPYPAATVALVRGAEAGREVLMLRRPAHSAFAPGAWVFPGGRLDAADLAFDHATLASGPPPSEWARLLSLPSPAAAAYAVAAIREAWEETGILIADRAIRCDQGEMHRADLLAGRLEFASALRALSARVATHRLHYIGRRITPEWLPRRFDTRFFLCEVGGDARCVLRGSELEEWRWIRPEAALHEAEARGMALLPPTIDTLRRLARGEIGVDHPPDPEYHPDGCKDSR